MFLLVDESCFVEEQVAVRVLAGSLDSQRVVARGQVVWQLQPQSRIDFAQVWRR